MTAPETTAPKTAAHTHALDALDALDAALDRIGDVEASFTRLGDQVGAVFASLDARGSSEIDPERLRWLRVAVDALAASRAKLNALSDHCETAADDLRTIPRDVRNAAYRLLTEHIRSEVDKTTARLAAVSPAPMSTNDKAADALPTARDVSLGKAAAVVGVSDDTLRRAIAAGELPSDRTAGGQHRVSVAELEAWNVQRGARQ